MKQENNDFMNNFAMWLGAYLLGPDEFVRKCSYSSSFGPRQSLYWRSPVGDNLFSKERFSLVMVDVEIDVDATRGVNISWGIIVSLNENIFGSDINQSDGSCEEGHHKQLFYYAKAKRDNDCNWGYSNLKRHAMELDVDLVTTGPKDMARLMADAMLRFRSDKISNNILSLTENGTGNDNNILFRLMLSYPDLDNDSALLANVSFAKKDQSAKINPPVWNMIRHNLSQQDQAHLRKEKTSQSDFIDTNIQQAWNNFIPQIKNHSKPNQTNPYHNLADKNHLASSNLASTKDHPLSNNSKRGNTKSFKGAIESQLSFPKRRRRRGKFTIGSKP